MRESLRRWPEDRRAIPFLAANLIRELGNALRGKRCRVAGSDLLLQTGRKEMYVYPDVTYRGGRPGAKSHEYRGTPSIRQYALISQDKPLVEIHTRNEDGSWLLTEVMGLDTGCAFSSLECSVPMAALYEGVLDLPGSD